jgi:hypothetical protein
MTKKAASFKKGSDEEYDKMVTNIVEKFIKKYEEIIFSEKEKKFILTFFKAPQIFDEEPHYWEIFPHENEMVEKFVKSGYLIMKNHCHQAALTNAGKRFCAELKWS